METFRRLQSFSAACLCALLAVLPASVRADGVYLTQHTRWKDGALTWFYNPAHTPPTMPHAQFIAEVQSGFDEWAKGCRISARYAGTTAVPADADRSDTTGQVTFGYYPFPEKSVMHARGGLFSRDKASGYAHATAGVVSLSTNPTPAGEGAPTHLSPGARLRQVLRHEIGHLLGLAHSTSPYSIMYYSWHAGNGVVTPQGVAREISGDDFNTCANLYGSNGVVERPYYGGLKPDPKLGISVALEPLPPRGQPARAASGKGSALDRIDLSKPVTAVRALRAGPGYSGGWVDWRLVAPSGDVYDLGLQDRHGRERNAELGRFGEFVSISTLDPARADPWLPAIPGKWRLQATVDGRLAAEHPFTLENGRVAPVGRAEMAVAVEKADAQAYTLRTAQLGRTGIVGQRFYVNGVAARQAFAAPDRPGVVEAWARTNLSRINYGNVEQDTPDIVMHVPFQSDKGQLAAARIDVIESGTPAAYSARATVETATAGMQHVYLIASGGGQTLYRQPDGSWAAREQPVFSFRAPGAAGLDLMRAINTHELPAGTTVRIAFGASLADATARGQVRLVRRFGAQAGGATAALGGALQQVAQAGDGAPATAGVAAAGSRPADGAGALAAALAP